MLVWMVLVGVLVHGRAAWIESHCGFYEVAMWSVVPFNESTLYSINSTVVVLKNDLNLLPLSSVPNSTSPFSLLLLDFSQMSSSAIWNFGKLPDVVQYYYQGGSFVGVLVRDFGIIPGVYNQFPWQELQFPYPVGLIGFDDFETLLDENCLTNVSFQSVNDFGNPWKSFVDSGGFAILHTTFLVVFFINLVLSVLRLKDVMFQVTIGSICLYCEVFANILYFLRFTTNITYAYSDVYNAHLVIGSELLTSLPVPFFLTASLLFVFFWLDITSTSNYLYDGKLLGAMRVPCAISIILLFLLEITSDSLRFELLNSVSSTQIDLAVAVFYGVMLILIIILNSLALYKVVNDTNKRSLKLNSIYQKVLINIVILLCVCILSFIASYVARLIVGYYIRRTLLFLLSGFQSMNQIIVFRTKSIKSHSKSVVDSQQKTTM